MTEQELAAQVRQLLYFQEIHAERLRSMSEQIETLTRQVNELRAKERPEWGE